MNLTENEKSTLKLLLNNSKITDSQIASDLGISSVAVGKIVKKLESSVIESYTVNLSYAKLGIQVFALAIAKLTEKGLERGELEVEQDLLKNPHIINVYRLPKANSTHIILYGFRDLEELDNFFQSAKNGRILHDFINTNELLTFSHNGLVKNNPMQLFCKVMEDMGNKVPKIRFNEIQKFKEGLK